MMGSGEGVEDRKTMKDCQLVRERADMYIK
jgi:hypothetical protein